VLPAVAGADAWADGDGDGFGDLEEALLQTDPADPLSALRFESVEQAGSELRLSFPAAPGREYVVERNDDFPAGRWDESARFVAAQTREVFTDAASGTTRRAFRVRAADYLPAKASEAAGFMRKTLSGHSDTLLSLPFTRVPEARGTVAAVQGSRVWIEAGTDWAPGGWVYAEGSQTNTYYLHIQTGAAAGGWHTITNSDAGSVTLSLGAATLAGLAAGDQVTIVPHWTIGSVFPGGNGVHTAPRPSSRPTELLFPKFEPVQINSAPASTYYFRNGIWQKVSSGLTNQGDVIIPPDRYILVRQNTNAATALVLHGMAGAAPWRISVGRSAGGSVDNHFALPRPHASTLNDSGLFESGAFRSSSRPGSRADDLLVYNLDLGGYNASPAATYYHYLGSWRRVGGGMTDFGEEPMLQPGYGFILRSTSSPESPAWSIPASY
jgi:uncharacterized protein (TIGR02597 family)